ncbi:hypothetical protein L228DRAFT_117481 [Xylona heveae TC161]|uniref:Uncharacterized protein n=1 Tax=Xylona heveae (strain CBS 132557 / TC161) TaxID=1328760 RepID=A0A165HGZ4_XYLHT|nr:hypothetical protein L228DRAFT_117481 [Xylona heveae TC161]KZF23500.1 hypothetical protein L228DRAFT_117481 [Xylona heveae TC161]
MAVSALTCIESNGITIKPNRICIGHGVSSFCLLFCIVICLFYSSFSVRDRER